MDGRVVLLALVLAMPASAQQVYKCVEGRQVSYQSEPCAGETIKAWDAKPERIDPAKEARIEALRRQVRTTKVPRSVKPPSGVAAGAKISIVADEAKCKAAKRDRDKTLRNAELRLQKNSRRRRTFESGTFELSRMLDDQVYSACK